MLAEKRDNESNGNMAEFDNGYMTNIARRYPATKDCVETVNYDDERFAHKIIPTKIYSYDLIIPV